MTILQCAPPQLYISLHVLFLHRYRSGFERAPPDTSSSLIVVPEVRTIGNLRSTHNPARSEDSDAPPLGPFDQVTGTLLG